MRTTAIFLPLTILGLVGLAGAGCAATPAAPAAHAKGAGAAATTSPDTAVASGGALADESAPDDGSPRRRPNADGSWIGASVESEVLLAGTTEATMGVWVDAPQPRTKVHTPVDLALVMDTSGSMAGAKLDNARAAARMLIENLPDGDIVSIDTFNDEARPLAPPTVLSRASRTTLLGNIAGLRVGGSTNLFDGLALGEAHVARAPATHSVRRVVVISDGIANVGPSTPEALGQLAERGVNVRAQVTAVGVGNDYDERTLNALAVRSSGRLYHIADPREMTSMLKHELDLLESTVASDAFVEVVPAPGVELVGTEGVRADPMHGGALKIPLGALFGGQHREALVRVRIRDAREAGGGQPLASVRLHFRDPGEGDLERVQETIARVSWTRDGSEVAAHENAKTKAIMAVQDAAKLQLQAAQHVNKGKFDDADKQLEEAEKKLAARASTTKDASERQRLTAAAQSMGTARTATRAAAAAPPAAQRSQALKMNAQAMDAYGY